MKKGTCITNAVTKRLREEGRTLSWWARVNNESYGMVGHVITGRARNPRIVEKLKRDGLWDLLPQKVKRFHEGNSNSPSRKPKSSSVKTLDKKGEQNEKLSQEPS